MRIEWRGDFENAEVNTLHGECFNHASSTTTGNDSSTNTASAGSARERPTTWSGSPTLLGTVPDTHLSLTRSWLPMLGDAESEPN